MGETSDLIASDCRWLNNVHGSMRSNICSGMLDLCLDTSDSAFDVTSAFRAESNTTEGFYEIDVHLAIRADIIQQL